MLVETFRLSKPSGSSSTKATFYNPMDVDASHGTITATKAVRKRCRRYPESRLKTMRSKVRVIVHYHIYDVPMQTVDPGLALSKLNSVELNARKMGGIEGTDI